MTDKLPPNLLKLFAPRPPLPFSYPLDRDPAKRKGPTISGIAHLVEQLKDYDADYVPWETVEEKRKKKFFYVISDAWRCQAEERKRKADEAIKVALEKWNPEKDEHVEGDPFKTLFVARLSYPLSEKDLGREFEMYGPIKRMRIVKDQEGKSRGYAFIEYEREKDMRAAYKDADGIKIAGRRIVVDVERGRTVKGWRPRRLGGGLGGTRIGGPDQNMRYSGRDGGPIASGYGGGADRDRERGYGGSSSSGGGGSGGYGGGGYGHSNGRSDYGGYGGRERGRGGAGYSGGSDRDRYGDRDRAPDRERERGGSYERPRRRGSRSRSRSPKSYKDRGEKDKYGSRGRDRSKDRDRDRDRGARR
ncbi:hypothetical protein BC937DRAFT_92677 [Endogone sp. FLAS-F59071]|nr:hypothetical protein BC937DRAFT_92677 [Endogone sp. FLAS-F59071]|eukprot:RUS15267.1 hypothetical protein BC937DRAFT_92677 [Endogone sp. FLAS-F59071]